MGLTTAIFLSDSSKRIGIAISALLEIVRDAMPLLYPKLRLTQVFGGECPHVPKLRWSN